MTSPAAARLDRSLPPAAAMLLGTVLVLPLLAVLVLWHARRHGIYSVWLGLDTWLARPLLAMPIVLAATVVHEALHGLAWAASGGEWRRVRFGWNWRALVPSAHYAGPLPATTYRVSAATPLVVLGLVPSIAGTLLGAHGVAVFGWLFTLGALGDLAALWLLRGVPGTALVEDHPTRVGCLIGAAEAVATDRRDAE